MTDYKINLQAEQDLEAIYRYGFERYGEASADSFYDALYQCFELIAHSPMTWPRVDHVKQGYRRYIYRQGGGRTSVYYRVVKDAVEIMAVVQRQDMRQR